MERETHYVCCPAQGTRVVGVLGVQKPYTTVNGSADQQVCELLLQASVWYA